MGAKIIMVGLPASDPDGAQDFWGDVLEYDFAPGLSQENSWHAIGSEDGVDLLIAERHVDEERPMPHFAVDDLDAAISKAEALGGTVTPKIQMQMPDAALPDYRALHRRERGPGQVTNTVGTAVIVIDPQGGMCGLVELEEHTHEHFKVGRFARQLDAKQLRTHREAIRIGRKLRRGGR
jgi:predicted enzyme related to lactoylglutathione lyase